MTDYEAKYREQFPHQFHQYTEAEHEQLRKDYYEAVRAAHEAGQARAVAQSEYLDAKDVHEEAKQRLETTTWWLLRSITNPSSE